MPAAAAVVVTDVTDLAHFERCLGEVARTVPRDVEVVGVSHRFPVLPKQLARRVVRQRPRSAADVLEAAQALATQPRPVVVLSSGCRVARGWWEELLPALAALGARTGALPGTPSPLTLHPADAVAGSPAVPLMPLARVTELLRPSPSPAALREPVRISASLIVKDEERVLAKCLEALAPFVDEVVVYDTGSTDGTVALARAHGARVVEGYWDDDFGAARNRSLAHCRHDWVLCVDADEVVVGDPLELRRVLARCPGNVLQAEVVSTRHEGSDSGTTLISNRAYRRSEVMWSGALHEQLTPRPGHLLRAAAGPAPFRLVHSGYHAATVHERNKAARNLAVTEAAVRDLPPDAPDAGQRWGDHARSLLMAERTEEAAEAFGRALDGRLNPRSTVTTGRAALHALLALRHLDHAERWIEAMAGKESAGNLAVWRAKVALARGDAASARAALTRAVASTDVWGVPFDPASATTPAILVDIHEDRHEAADRGFRRQIAEHPTEVDLGLLMAFSAAVGVPVAQYLAGCPDELLERTVREALVFDGDAADRWLTALHEAHPEDPRPVVAGCFVAARHTVGSMLRWSVAAREIGITDPCPLRLHATNEAADSASRCLAWAILADAYGEEDAAEQWLLLLPQVPEDELPGLGAHLEELAPGLLAPA